MKGTKDGRERGHAAVIIFWSVAAEAVAYGLFRMSADIPLHAAWWILALLGLSGLGLELVLWRRRASGSRGSVAKMSRKDARNQGVASRWAILKTASRWTMRRKARVLLPSLRNVGWLQRLRVPTTAYATRLGRVGWFTVWSPCEDVTLRVGGPRVGKTGEIANHILDAPGAVIATSTRTDLIDLTADCRAKTGPVHVFNPAGLGSMPSTIVFDPLAGCTTPKTAVDRASDLLSGVSAPGSDSGDREFWTGQARRVLASLLHAAALGECGMRDVARWVADPDAGEADIARFLRRSPSSAFEADAAQFLGTNDRTRSSICATIMPALGWLIDDTAATAAGVDQHPGSTALFDVEQLLEQHGTVYMLGAEDATTAPLVTALTGTIAREARRLAALEPGGRLDPPLTLVLDEAAIICPIPLDQWTADMGGRNVTIHIGAQSRAQLRQRWGEVGAAAIVNNAATIMIFGGTRDPDDLAAYSTLTGERDEEVATFDTEGRVTSTTTRRVPVMTAAQIAQLPAGRMVLIRRGMPPVIAKARMAWTRRDVKAAQRARAKMARAAARQEKWATAGATATRWAQMWTASAYDRAPTLTARLAKLWAPIRQVFRGPDPETFGLTRFADTTWTDTDLNPHTDGGSEGGWS